MGKYSYKLERRTKTRIMIVASKSAIKKAGMFRGRLQSPNAKSCPEGGSNTVYTSSFQTFSLA